MLKAVVAQNNWFKSNVAAILKEDQEDGKPFVIAGYASVDIIDKDNERISLPALRDAFDRMMKRVSRRNLILHHSNVQIGELLKDFTDSSGKTWKSGVDDVGLFIVAEVFNDIEMGRRVIEAMRKGHLLSFSVGGKKLRDEIKCDDKKCWNEIVQLDLHEVTSCERGVNPMAKGFILKGSNENGCGLCRGGCNVYKGEVGKVESAEKYMEVFRVDSEQELKLMQAIDGLTALVKDVAEELKAAKKKPKEYYYYQKPQKSEFTKEQDYYEALESWISPEAEKARKKKVEEEEEEKLKKDVEASIVAEAIADVDKASYREFVAQQMKAGKTMAEAAAEWKKRKKEAEDAEKAKKPNEYYKYPKKEDFASEDEFKEAEKGFNELKAQVVKDLGLPVSSAGAASMIKKSKTPKEVSSGFDIKKVDAAGKESKNLREFIRKEVE